MIFWKEMSLLFNILLKNTKKKNIVWLDIFMVTL